MTPRLILLILLASLRGGICFAQNTIEEDTTINYFWEIKYHVLREDRTIKDGEYQALYGKKLMAYGFYKNNAKIGLWRFYSRLGTLLQTYDFANNRYAYNEFDPYSYTVSYRVDRKHADTDEFVPPFRIGGQYFGLLPYLAAFRSPFMTGAGVGFYYKVTLELLISPLGRLADYKLHFVAPDPQYSQNITLSTALFKEEDKQFVPAKINGEPAMCRIIIRCILMDDGSLDFY